MAEDGEGSQTSQSVLNPGGFKPELRILRSFVVLRCSALRATQLRRLRMTKTLLRECGQTAPVHERLVAKEDDEREVEDANEDALRDGHVVERLVVPFAQNREVHLNGR